MHIQLVKIILILRYIWQRIHIGRSCSCLHRSKKFLHW